MAHVLDSVLGMAALLAIGLSIAIALATIYVTLRLRRPPRRTVAWALANGAPSDPSEMDSPLVF